MPKTIVVTVGQKVFIGALLPVLLCSVVGFVAMMGWPRADFGPAGQLLTALGLLGYFVPACTFLNLWVVALTWEKLQQCFLAGMCVPVIGVITTIVVYHAP